MRKQKIKGVFRYDADFSVCFLFFVLIAGLFLSAFLMELLHVTDVKTITSAWEGIGALFGFFFCIAIGFPAGFFGVDLIVRLVLVLYVDE